MCSKNHLLSIGHHRKHLFFYYKNILWCNAFNAPLTSCRFYERILLWKRKENCIKMKVIGNFISLLLSFNLLIVIKAFEKIDGQALNDISYFHSGKNNNGILFPKLFWPSVRKKMFNYERFITFFVFLCFGQWSYENMKILCNMFVYIF